MPVRSIYLVMDMLNDLIGPEAGMGAEAARRGIVARTAAALAKARAAGVRVGFSPDYKECPPNSPVFSPVRQAGLLRLGTPGTTVVAGLEPRPEDFDIVKHRVSPFYGTNLEPILRARGIGRLYLSGVSTNGVVHTGVREAHDRDYELVVLEDCCCARSAEEHEATMAMLARFATIASSADVDFGAA